MKYIKIAAIGTGILCALLVLINAILPVFFKNSDLGSYDLLYDMDNYFTIANPIRYSCCFY